ncbi:MAG: DUF4199 domain-containing protein [Alistipes sp.]|nr:DUF4199 domain-containing protein [Alistipes sp.]
MINREYWHDVLRSGAILGLVMALSSIFERYLLLASNLTLGTATMLYLGEAVVACVVFIWLIVRFTRRRRDAGDPRFGFNYSTALSYILLISMLAGVIVGVAGTIFTSAIGYDAYIAGNISRLEEAKTLYEGLGVGANDLVLFDEMVHRIRTAPQPTMLQNVLASFSNYILFGGIPGLIIAGVLSRNPQAPIEEN